MPRRAPPVVLTIAGFDPSSGAGATADLKTIAAHRCYGVACLTALTVQTSRGVQSVEPVPDRLVSATLWDLAYDFNFDAVKIGMLATAPIVDAVALFLRRVMPPNVVLDPVLQSSSGTELLDQEGRVRLSKRLLRLATVITPNLAEAAFLSGLPVGSLAEMKSAAERLHRLGARNVVITGGHLKRPVDLLSMAAAKGCEQVEFAGERVRSAATHGTGCAFSSALACNLAWGEPLHDAVRLAKEYVTQAIRNACTVGGGPLGEGSSALNHLYAVEEQLRGRRSTSQPLRRPPSASKTKKSAPRRR
ncbi:MAG: bifunctional hydroxymethylpyrimidine kinase/phosphomethylpyrimidine kinase [Terriglobales bacterium]